MDERHFRRMEKFDGSENKWKEWSFQLKTSLGAVNPKARNLLEDIHRHAKDPDWDTIFVDVSEDHVTKIGAELYSLLVSLLSDEALMVVRGVVGGNGWEAWQKLAARFDPRTPARALRAMMLVMQPKKVKDVREMQSAVEEWEIRIKQLKVEHEIDVDDRIKVALLTGMLPADFQDYVFQWSDGKVEFKEVRDKVLTLAMNRASLGRPMPMEIGKVWAEEWHDDTAEEYNGDYACWPCEGGEEKEVNYVGEACRNCGGHGHYARECPTPKGKGKGEKGKGKGKGKRKRRCRQGKREQREGQRRFRWRVLGLRRKGPQIVRMPRVQEGRNGGDWQCGGGRRHENHGGVDHRPGDGGVRGGGLDGQEAEPELQEQEHDREQGHHRQKCRRRRSRKCRNTTPSRGVDQHGQQEGGVEGGRIGGDHDRLSGGRVRLPQELGRGVRVEAARKWLKFTTASGARMGHYGAREATFKTQKEKTIMSLGFQVSDVQKPLAAVWRIAEKGNLVQFGPRPEDNFIRNIQTNQQVQMVRKGGSYVIEADFVTDGQGFPGQALMMT